MMFSIEKKEESRRTRNRVLYPVNQASKHRRTRGRCPAQGIFCHLQARFQRKGGRRRIRESCDFPTNKLRENPELRGGLHIVFSQCLAERITIRDRIVSVCARCIDGNVVLECKLLIFFLRSFHVPKNRLSGAEYLDLQIVLERGQPL